MSICLCGSKPKSTSLPEFSITDTGAFCFLLGLNATICQVIDIIPSLVGLSWRKIIKKVGEASFGVLVDEITGQINTASFCGTEPPPLPSDITYLEVFQWIASYVPVVGNISSSDPLLKKITAFYLYSKWFELCECKAKCYEPPLPNNPIPNIPFPTTCSKITQTALQQANDYINLMNRQNVDDLALYATFNANAKAQYEETKNFYDTNYPSPPYIRSFSDDTIIFPLTYTDVATINYGCILLVLQNQLEQRTATKFEDVFELEQNGSLRPIRTFFQLVAIAPIRRILDVDLSYCECNPPPPILQPPPTITYEPPPPKAPDNFCALYPNSLFCREGCDTEDILVSVFNGCNAERSTLLLKLNKSGTTEAIAVEIFDDCGNPRNNETRTIFNCE